MRIMLALFVLGMASLGPSWAQTRPAPSLSFFEQVVAGIEKGDHLAIDAAGSSGNAAFIPHLRAFLVRKKYSTPNALLALAALGDREGLQIVACLVRSENPEVTVTAIQSLRWVRGWFSIQLLGKFLAEPLLEDKVWEARYRKYLGVSPDDADIYRLMPPTAAALTTLPHVIPDLPDSVPPDPGLVLELVAKWKPFFQEWIRTHEADLRKLKPTGEGIDLSEKACSTRRIRKLAKRIERAWLRISV